jgi:BirA family biotin operon repressor/biotin-[acetyl-CoA-carboxylase] ligase
VDRLSATGDGHWRVDHVAETGSTNDDLAAAARAGAPDGTVLVADYQRAGRGRLGRRWEAPEGSSLLVSILLRPQREAANRVHGATQAVALAARAACAYVGGFRPALKWPNDLLVGERKLAGILAEGVAQATDVPETSGSPSGAGRSQLSAVVVGMGLNVSWPPEPTELALSASWCAGRPLSRAELLDSFLRNLTTYRKAWEDDPATLRSDYAAALATLGRPVSVETPGGTFVGVAVDVGEQGELVLETDGRRRIIHAGDVVHLRAVSPG